jgi:hypothetical protein
MKFLCIFFILCLPSLTFGQDKISGKVVSEKGEALQGASVFISNTKIGVNTDAQGEFVLAKVPVGNTEIVISYIGYEATSVVIPAADRYKRYMVKLRLQSNDLAAVIVGNYDKRGWKKWGKSFSEAFIGTSAYEKGCDITNKDVIRFNYNKKTNRLHAYAAEPLLIQNKSLGYNISVTMVDFVYDFSSKDVDYQVYSLFAEMQGTDDQQLEWKKNREDVYSLSVMHFMRALYANNCKNEGFQVRIIERNVNREKQRVQALYKNTFAKIKDSLGSNGVKENAVNKLIENNFSKDSLLYYQSVFKQNDRTENLHLELAGFKDIARKTDSGTVLFHFNDFLQITYIKAKEPVEYAAYKNKQYPDLNTPESAVQRVYPNTELTLTQGIPVEINESGYFNNIDLFMYGFWGWWERIATKLPYEYEP